MGGFLWLHTQEPYKTAGGRSLEEKQVLNQDSTSLC